jgi:hypothetical protein
MQPVRIKIYGLVPMKRRTYLTMQATGVALLLVVLIVWLVLRGWQTPTDLPPVDVLTRTTESPTGEIVIKKTYTHVFGAPYSLYVWKYVPALLGLVLFLEALETWAVLRRFRKAELLQRVSEPAIPADPQP